VTDRFQGPETPAAVSALAEVRDRIDDTDRKLMRLLDQRIELALRAGRLKGQIADPAREAKVLEKVRASAHGLLSVEFVTSLYGAIIEESRRVQSTRPRLAGFQGERGAWSEMACQSWDADLVPAPCRSFADVFDAVSGGSCDVGVVPVENSLGGAIIEVSDLLIARDVFVVGEIVVPVRQCLLALPGTRLRDIRSVYSHPQALVQCRAFLAAHDLDAQPFYDTAGAARWLMFEGARTAGAIASPLAATLYGLEVVADSIADEPANETRFLVIAPAPRASGGNRCSIVLTTEDRAGALAEALGVFSIHGINLSRIESRPTRTRPGTYAFLIDFHGSQDAEGVVNALAALRSQCVSLKVLGFYDAAPTASPQSASSAHCGIQPGSLPPRDRRAREAHHIP
jgi:prephenate dehydratase/chorismate mutase